MNRVRSTVVLVVISTVVIAIAAFLLGQQWPMPFNSLVQLAEVFTGLAGVCAWPLFALLLLLAFQAPISNLLEKMEPVELEASVFGVRYLARLRQTPETMTSPDPQDLQREGLEQSLPRVAKPEDSPLTLDGIEKALQRIPDLVTQKEVVQEHLVRIYSLLAYNGVVSQPQLDALIRSEGVLNVLRTLYITELERNPNMPLDPVAVASHGAFLFTRGLTDDVIEVVRIALWQSPEYVTKAGKRLTDPNTRAEDQIRAAQNLGLYGRDKKRNLDLLIEAADYQYSSGKGYGPVQAEIATAIANIAMPGDDRPIEALNRLLEAAHGYPPAERAVREALRRLSR